MQLDGKVAIITGAASGIGRAIAEAFIAERARIVLADVATDEGERTAISIRDGGGESLFIRTDVSVPEDVGNLVEATLSEFRRIDILVNNAAISTYEPFLEIPFESWTHIMAVNLTGVFLCSQAVAKVMARCGGGRIINLASTNSFIAERHAAHYVASKGAVAALTRAMAVDLAPYGILVNAIAPGPIRTHKTASAFAEPASSSRILSRTVLGRPGEVEEVASVAVFLASADASYITGHILAVDGGLLAS